MSRPTWAPALLAWPLETACLPTARFSTATNSSLLSTKPTCDHIPAIVQTASDDLEMAYSWNRKTIEHVHFPLVDVHK